MTICPVCRLGTVAHDGSCPVCTPSTAPGAKANVASALRPPNKQMSSLSVVIDERSITDAKKSPPKKTLTTSSTLETLIYPPEDNVPHTANGPVSGDVRVPAKSLTSSSTYETLIFPRTPNDSPEVTDPRSSDTHTITKNISLSDGKFEPVEELGRGGMGIILRSRDRRLGRDVALKVIRDPNDEQKRHRFISEAQITGQLEHPNIVPVHEFGVDKDGRIFFAMKLVRGRTLADIIDGLQAGHEKIKQDYPISRLVTILINICHAMSFAHSRGVIHRDLKPSNIMLGDYGEVMVMDWGLAKNGVVDRDLPLADDSVKTISRPDQTVDGTIMGTPFYMPPEQAMGNASELDQRSDIYSLGAILYEVITQKPPVEGSNFEEVVTNVIRGAIVAPHKRFPQADIPKDLAAVAMKALSHSPQDRYPDMVSMRRDLELFIEGRMTSARDDNIAEIALRFYRRHTISSITAISALVIIGVLATLGFIANDRLRRQAENSRAEAEQLADTAQKERAEVQQQRERADTERKRAEEAQRLAMEQQQLAEQARKRIEIALDSESRMRQRSELLGYFSSLSLASEQLERHEFTQARITLDACPLSLRNWTWRHLALASQPHDAQSHHHVGAITSSSTSHTRGIVATGGVDRSLHWYDIAARTHQGSLPLAHIPLRLALAENAEVCAVLDDHEVTLWSLTTSNVIQRHPVTDAQLIAINDAGTQAAYVTSTGQLWRWQSGSDTWQAIAMPRTTFTHLRYLKDNRLLVCGTSASAKQNVSAIFPAHSSTPKLATLPGRTWAVTRAGISLQQIDMHLSLYDLQSGLQLRRLPDIGIIPERLSLSEDLAWLVVSDKQGTVTAISLTSDVPNRVLPDPSPNASELQLVHVNDSHLVVSGGDDGIMRVCYVTSARERQQITMPATVMAVKPVHQGFVFIHHHGRVDYFQAASAQQHLRYRSLPLFRRWIRKDRRSSAVPAMVRCTHLIANQE
jgi:serine/threonine protein kinase